MADKAQPKKADKKSEDVLASALASHADAHEDAAALIAKTLPPPLLAAPPEKHDVEDHEANKAMVAFEQVKLAVVRADRDVKAGLAQAAQLALEAAELVHRRMAAALPSPPAFTAADSPKPPANRLA